MLNTATFEKDILRKSYKNYVETNSLTSIYTFKTEPEVQMAVRNAIESLRDDGYIETSKMGLGMVYVTLTPYGLSSLEDN